MQIYCSFDRNSVLNNLRYTKKKINNTVLNNFLLIKLFALVSFQLHHQLLDFLITRLNAIKSNFLPRSKVILDLTIKPKIFNICSIFFIFFLHFKKIIIDPLQSAS